MDITTFELLSIRIRTKHTHTRTDFLQDKGGGGWAGKSYNLKWSRTFNTSFAFVNCTTPTIVYKNYSDKRFEEIYTLKGKFPYLVLVTGVRVVRGRVVTLPVCGPNTHPQLESLLLPTGTIAFFRMEILEPS